MAQAGIHALVGAATRRLVRKWDWLTLGIILGSIFPDLDNFAVAVATIARLDTHGLHRTATHSILVAGVIVALFTFIGKISRQPRWANLGIGLGIGMVLHTALDLLIWFNGVQLLWPLNFWVNFWEGTKPAEWFSRLFDPAEFLFMALYFLWLIKTARDNKTDSEFLGALRFWIIGMFASFVVFTPLAFVMNKGFQTIFGLFYLISITAAFIITIRMRQTIG